jgi:crotonobetaine/carnitine-CoA ligase
MTFAQRWETAVRTSGDRPFLIFEAPDGSVSEWTYREFDEVVTQTCATLAAAGVGAGSSVHVALRNCPAFVAIWLACARSGAWLVPVDPTSTARDISRHLDRVRPAVGICAASRADVYAAGVKESAAGQLSVIELAETAADVASGAGPDGPRVCPAAVAPTDRLAVMFTSGTTSEPKGVVLTQHNYAHVADTMSAIVGLRPEHRWLITLPLFHANAQYYCIAPAIAVGASVALTSAFSASQWLRQARDLAATHASLFAAPIRMILARRPADAPAVRLEHVWFAQNLGAQHYEEFAALAGCRPRQLYGMTETVAIVCADVCDPYRNDTIGPPVEGRPVVIRNPETGADALPGEPGELVLRGVPGADIFLEYLNDPVVTGRSLVKRDGATWFHTGDMVARIAGNSADSSAANSGALRFVGRRDDVIKVSGENVSLTEVEATLAQAPGVLECAVLGRPDPVRDMVPVAYIVPRDRAQPPSVSDLAAWSERNLPAAARPRDWHLIEALPRTSVGKVRRFKLLPGTRVHRKRKDKPWAMTARLRTNWTCNESCTTTRGRATTRTGTCSVPYSPPTHGSTIPRRAGRPAGARKSPGGCGSR